MPGGQRQTLVMLNQPVQNLPVGLTAMSNSDNQYETFAVLYLVNDAVVADADAPQAGKLSFEGSAGRGIVLEFIDAVPLV